MRCGNSLVPLMYLYTDGLHKVSPTETNEVKCILPFLSTWVNLCAWVQETRCKSSSSLLYEDNCDSWQGAQWQLLHTWSLARHYLRKQSSCCCYIQLWGCLWRLQIIFHFGEVGPRTAWSCRHLQPTMTRSVWNQHSCYRYRRKS